MLQFFWAGVFTSRQAAAAATTAAGKDGTSFQHFKVFFFSFSNYKIPFYCSWVLLLFLQTQLLGLGGSVDAGVLQKLKEQQHGDQQALQARIIQLEGQVSPDASRGNDLFLPDFTYSSSVPFMNLHSQKK